MSRMPAPCVGGRLEEAGAEMQIRWGNHSSDRMRHQAVIVIGMVCSVLLGRQEGRGAVTLIGQPISLAGSHTWNPAACYNAHSDQFLLL